MINIPFPMLQGEHVAIIGDTGTGKSTLMVRLLERRAYVLTVLTKGDKLKWPGKTLTRAKQLSPQTPRWVIKPDNDRIKQRGLIAGTLQQAWKQRAWTIAFDELYYVDAKLRLEDDVDTFLTQGRSLDLTIVMGMQRPVSVTRFAISQASHVICFAQDGRDSKTVTDATSSDLRAPLARLGRYQFLWYHRPGREYWIGSLDLKSGVLVPAAQTQANSREGAT